MFTTFVHLCVRSSTLYFNLVNGVAITLLVNMYKYLLVGMAALKKAYGVGLIVKSTYQIACTG